MTPLDSRMTLIRSHGLALAQEELFLQHGDGSCETRPVVRAEPVPIVGLRIQRAVILAPLIALHSARVERDFRLGLDKIA